MHATPSQRVGATIREHMDSAGVTQTALSVATGITQPALSRKLSGERDFTLGELYRIAAALRIRASVLVEAA